MIELPGKAAFRRWRMVWPDGLMPRYILALQTRLCQQRGYGIRTGGAALDLSPARSISSAPGLHQRPARMHAKRQREGRTWPSIRTRPSAKSASTASTPSTLVLLIRPMYRSVEQHVPTPE